MRLLKHIPTRMLFALVVAVLAVTPVVTPHVSAQTQPTDPIFGGNPGAAAGGGGNDTCKTYASNGDVPRPGTDLIQNEPDAPKKGSENSDANNPAFWIQGFDAWGSIKGNTWSYIGPNRQCIADDRAQRKFVDMIETGLQGTARYVLGGLRGVLEKPKLFDQPDMSKVQDLWKQILFVVNVFFVLVLSAIAFSSILRIDLERYSVRRLLPVLIFAVIAVNFSFIFVKLFTNMAVILANANPNFLTDAQKLIENAPKFAGLATVYEFGGNASGWIQIMVSFFALVVIIVPAVLLLAFIILRSIVIAILTAFAPIAVLCLTLPSTRPFAGRWLLLLLRWVAIMPIMLFTLYAGNMIRIQPANGMDLKNPAYIYDLFFFATVLLAAIFVPIWITRLVANAVRGSGKASKATTNAMREALKEATKEQNQEKIAHDKDTAQAQEEKAAVGATSALRETGDRLRNVIGKITGAEPVADHNEPKNPLEGSDMPNDEQVKKQAAVMGSAQERAVAAYKQQMLTMDPAAKKRIAYAAAGITKADKDGNLIDGKSGKAILTADGQNIKALPGHVYDEKGKDLGEMQQKERSLMRSKFAPAAAAKDLAENGKTSPRLNAAYISTGVLNAKKITLTPNENSDMSEDYRAPEVPKEQAPLDAASSRLAGGQTKADQAQSERNEINAPDTSKQSEFEGARGGNVDAIRGSNMDAARGNYPDAKPLDEHLDESDSDDNE